MMKMFNFLFAFVGVLASFFVRLQAHSMQQHSICGCTSATLNVYCDNYLDEVATFDNEGTKLSSNQSLGESSPEKDWQYIKTIDNLDITSVSRIELTCRDVGSVGGILAVLDGCGGDAIETDSNTIVQEEDSATSLEFYVDGSKSTPILPNSTALVYSSPNGPNAWSSTLAGEIANLSYITDDLKWVWDNQITNTIVLGINFDECTATPPNTNLTCDDVWHTPALGPEGLIGSYYTCGARIVHMQGKGLSPEEARNFVGCEVPTNETCGVCKSEGYVCPPITNSPTAVPTTENPTTAPTVNTTVQPTGNPTTSAPTAQPTETPTTSAPTAQPTETPTYVQNTLQPTKSPAENNPACAAVWNTPALGPEGHTYTCGGRVDFMMNSGLSLQQARNYVGCEIPTNETCGVCKADDYVCPITPNPTPAPSPSPGGGDGDLTIIIVVTSCGVLFLILGLACVVCMMRRRKAHTGTNVIINNFASKDCDAVPPANTFAPDVYNPSYDGPKYI